MLYQKGDRLVVREDISLFHRYRGQSGVSIVARPWHFGRRGQTLTVDRCMCGAYIMKEVPSRQWVDGMFAGLENETYAPIDDVKLDMLLDFLDTETQGGNES